MLQQRRAALRAHRRLSHTTGNTHTKPTHTPATKKTVRKRSGTHKHTHTCRRLNTNNPHNKQFSLRGTTSHNTNTYFHTLTHTTCPHKKTKENEPRNAVKTRLWAKGDAKIWRRSGRLYCGETRQNAADFTGKNTGMPQVTSMQTRKYEKRCQNHLQKGTKDHHTATPTPRSTAAVPARRPPAC